MLLLAGLLSCSNATSIGMMMILQLPIPTMVSAAWLTTNIAFVHHYGNSHQRRGRKVATGRRGGGELTISEARASSQQQERSDSTPPLMTLRRHHRILCYGDSLTAGIVMNDDGTINRYYPYGPHLERVLRQQQSSSSSPTSAVMVRSRGIPGWTANAMTQDLDGPNTGLRSALQALSVMPMINAGMNDDDDDDDEALHPLDDIADGVSLAIILAGTNDLGFGFGGAQEIAENIIQLHRICYQNNVPHTLAIAVPPSSTLR